MAQDYGQLNSVVAISGTLIGAGTAIGLAWMRRAKWMPPVESVPGGTAKVSALLCSAVIGILFLERVQLGLGYMVVIVIACLVLTVIALGVSVYTNTTHSFIRRTNLSGKQGPIETRVLGGRTMTEEAARISQKKNLGAQQLYENANYKADLVWTKQSQALVQVASTMGFILLQASGSIALASVAIAFGLRPP
jgi:hypothetical protein